jgi:hypothetical protein
MNTFQSWGKKNYWTYKIGIAQFLILKLNVTITWSWTLTCSECAWVWNSCEEYHNRRFGSLMNHVPKLQFKNLFFGSVHVGWKDVELCGISSKKAIGKFVPITIFFVGRFAQWMKSWRTWPHFLKEFFLGKFWLSFVTFHPLCDLANFYILGEK